MIEIIFNILKNFVHKHILKIKIIYLYTDKTKIFLQFLIKQEDFILFTKIVKYVNLTRLVCYD